MKYMGWSYPQLLACPLDYLEVISDMLAIADLKRRAEEAGRRHFGG